ncbi:hypothetical protein BCV70DRAFT_201390 [Testicularia cyperi]|uniref:Uncharacterized protein n=1 Tax=Testicularia cyperi TaxID=1882483 RepID=A0A317XLH9_9BASI|nr:hypothetical protein BCV70DRAFT_201390 [Testicularia cyperi]
MTVKAPVVPRPGNVQVRISSKIDSHRGEAAWKVAKLPNTASGGDLSRFWLEGAKSGWTAVVGAW